VIKQNIHNKANGFIVQNDKIKCPMTIPEVKQLKESEDRVEFKAAERNFQYAGGSHTAQEDRRKC